MLNLKQIKLSHVLLFATLQMIFALPTFAYGEYQAIDSIRAELYQSKDRFSKNHAKNKQKLEDLIIQNDIDYSTRARFDDIQRLIREDKYNIALYELNDLLSNKIDTEFCHELLGDIYFKNDKFNDAEKNYLESLKIAPMNNNARFKLAKLYISNKKNISGINCLKKIASLSNDKDFLNEVEYFIRSSIKPQNNYEANNLFEILGDIYLKTNKTNDSYNAYFKAIRFNPSDIYLKYYLGDLFYEDNRIDEAIVMYNSILQENPRESQIRNSKAKSLIKKGQLLSANKEYLTMLSQYPDSNQAKYGIYKIYEDKLTPDKILEKVNETNPDYKPTKQDMLRFANILEDLGDKDGAQNFRDYSNNKFQEPKTLVKQKTVAPKKVEPIAQKPIEEVKKEVQQHIQKTIQEPAAKVQEQVQTEVEKTEETAQQPIQEAIDEQYSKVEEEIQQPIQEEIQQPTKEEIQNPIQEEIKEQGQEELKQDENLKQAPKPLLKNKRTQKPLKQKIDDKEQLQTFKISPFESNFEQAKSIEESQNQDTEEIKTTKEETSKKEVVKEPVKEVQEITPQKTQTLTENKIQKIEPEDTNGQNEGKTKQIKKDKPEKITKAEPKKSLEETIKEEQTKAKEKDPKKYEELKKVVDQYQAQEQKTAETYFAIANTYRQMGEPTNALLNFKEALKLAPDISDVNYAVGLAYLELNDLESSEEYATKALKLDENNTKARNLLNFIDQKQSTKIINKAYSDFEAKKYIEALNTLDEGIKKYSSLPQLYYYRALVYDAMNRNAAQIMDLEQAIKLAPGYYMAYYQLGHAYEKIKNERQALVSYERFLSIEPDDKELVDEVQKKVILLGAKYY